MSVWSESQRALLAGALALADRGFLAGVGGNLALRIDDAHFAVTPSATDYYGMHPDDICVLRLDDLRVVAGGRAPSVESGLHARVLRRRPDCHASVHTHQPVASAFGLLGLPFTVPPRWQGQLGQLVPVCGYAPSGTSWLAVRAAGRCGPGIRALLLRNHGVLGLAASLEAASDVVIALEQALREWFDASLAGTRGDNATDILAALRGPSPVEASR